MKPFSFVFAALGVASSTTRTHAACDLQSIQMTPSESDDDHPRAPVFGDDNYVQRCDEAGGDVISFSGRTVCEGTPYLDTYDRTDHNWPLCVPPSCDEDDLEEAIAQQLFVDEILSSWATTGVTCTGSYEFEGMGDGHSEVLQCFFDAQDSHDPVMKSFDQYQDELKEDPVNHVLSLEKLKELCDTSGMDYFKGSWSFVCNENTEYEVELKEVDLPRCLPKSCTQAGGKFLVENWYNLNFARQPSICKMKDYTFTDLDEVVSGSPDSDSPVVSASPTIFISVRKLSILLAVVSWSVSFFI